MKRSVRNILFVVLLGLVAQPMSIVASTKGNDAQWTFAEETFVDKLDQKTAKASKKIAKLGGAAAGLAPGAILSLLAIFSGIELAYINKNGSHDNDGAEFDYQAVSEHIPFMPSEKQSKRGGKIYYWSFVSLAALLTCASGAALAALPYVGYKWVEKLQSKKVQFELLKEFVSNFPKHQKLLPAELIEATGLENVYEQYTKIRTESYIGADKYLKTVAPEVIKNIRHAIYKKYSNRYELELQAEQGSLGKKALKAGIFTGAALGAAGVVGLVSFLAGKLWVHNFGDDD